MDEYWKRLNWYDFQWLNYDDEDEDEMRHLGCREGEQKTLTHFLEDFGKKYAILLWASCKLAISYTIQRY